MHPSAAGFRFRSIADNSLLSNSNVSTTNLIGNGNERNPFLEWISGIFGVTTTTSTEGSVLMSPPETCAECGNIYICFEF